MIGVFLILLILVAFYDILILGSSLEQKHIIIILTGICLPLAIAASEKIKKEFLFIIIIIWLFLGDAFGILYL